MARAWFQADKRSRSLVNHLVNGLFLILRPKKYKYHLTILDVSSGGLISSRDRGGWIDDRTTRTGEFRLMKNKTARLKMPPRKAALTSRVASLVDSYQVWRLAF